MGLGSKHAINYYTKLSKDNLESEEVKQEKEELDQVLEKNKFCISNGCRCLLGCEFSQNKECKRITTK